METIQRYDMGYRTPPDAGPEGEYVLYTDHIAALAAKDAAISALKGAVHADVAEFTRDSEQIRVLREAIAWALGENDDFRAREPGEGAYWWRKELRERAALASTAPVAEEPLPPNIQHNLNLIRAANGGSK